jgi:hypothetical protein
VSKWITLILLSLANCARASGDAADLVFCLEQLRDIRPGVQPFEIKRKRREYNHIISEYIAETESQGASREQVEECWVWLYNNQQRARINYEILSRGPLNSRPLYDGKSVYVRPHYRRPPRR